MCDIMPVHLECALDKKPAYSKYDYRIKDMVNNRNSYFQKTMRTNYKDIKVAVPCDRNEGFPQLIKTPNIVM